MREYPALVLTVQHVLYPPGSLLTIHPVNVNVLVAKHCFLFYCAQENDVVGFAVRPQGLLLHALLSFQRVY